MKLIWQIVRKDLYKLQIPLALWLGLLVLRVGFYVGISGFFGPPHWNALGLVWGFVEGPFCFLIHPLAVYLFAGWIVFADPLVERDAFWITRPISGRRLLAAKLAVAGLIAFVLPVVVSLPWWLTCGLGAKEIVLAAVLQHGPMLGVALLGMTMAAVTDGFPRYVLWTVAGGAVAAVVQMTVAWATGAQHVSFNANASRVAITLVLAAGVFGAVILHQYITRRLRRSVCLLIAGLVMAIVAGSLSRWDLSPLVEPAPVPAQPGDDKVQVRLAGPIRFEITPPRRGAVWIPIQIDGLPDEALRWVRMRGEWSWNGRMEWSTHGGERNFPQPPEAIRRLKHLPGLDEPRKVGMTMSAVLAERMKREPAAFHGSVDIHVHHGAVKAEMALRNQTLRNEFGSFSISNVREAKGVLSLEFTRRQFSLHPWRYRWWLGGVALVRRSDGAMVTSIPQATTGVIALLDSTLIVTNHLEFRSPSDSHWFDDADLVLVEYDEERIIQRTLDIDPFQLGEKTAE
jgi:hypothetical protein